MRYRIFLLLFIASSNVLTAQVKPSPDITQRITEWLAKRYPDAQKETRRFIYSLADLNGDKKEEYLIGLMGLDFCGTGGCNMLVVSDDFKVLANMSIVKYPVYAGDRTKKQLNKGYSNLYIRTGGVGWVNAMWNGSRYPSNPSLAPKVSESVIKGKTPLLMAEDQEAYRY